MKINHFAVSLALLAVFASCEEKVLPADESVSLAATLENGREWNAGDEVVINGAKYTIENGGESTVTIEVPKSSSYTGAYDFGSGSVSGSALKMELPARQDAGAETALPMVACNSVPSLSFKNVLGTLRLNVTGDKTLSRIVVMAGDGTMLAGGCTVPLDFGSAPKVVWDETASSTLTYSFGSQGGQLSTSPVAVDILLPAGNYGGFTVNLYDTEGGAMLDCSVNVPEIKRGGTVTEDVVYEPASVEELVYMKATVENDADGAAFSWKVSTPLYINGTPVQLHSGEGTAMAEYGPVVAADKYYVSTSSASINGVTGSQMIVNIPAKQKYGSGLFSVNPAVAVAASADDNIELKYVAGVVKATLSGPHKILSAELQSKDNTRIAGNGLVNMTASDFPLSLNADASKAILVDCGAEGTETDNGAEFRFVLPAGEYATGFTLSFTDSNGQTFVNEIPSVTVRRNAVTDMGAFEWEGGQGGENDLSKYGTANCYMVHAPGAYSFRTRRVDNTSVENIAKVDWLWATKTEGSDGNVLVSDISYNDGFVSFNASDKEGNVLLAAFDGNGAIVWSWHIWLTDLPKTFDYENNPVFQSGGKTDGFYVMDRNLGAVGTEGYEAFGLIYQWGRKDPFMFSHTEETEPFDKASELTVFNSAYEQAVWQSLPCDRTIGSVDYATAHPMLFIYAGPDGSQSNWLHKDNIEYDWKWDADKNLWRPSQKTKYDPCPPGYQVPKGRVFSVVEDLHGYVAGSGISHEAVDGTTWFPFQGYRPAHPSDKGVMSDINEVDGYIGIWSSEMSTKERAYSFTVSYPSVNASASDNPWGDGLAVRCVKAYGE